MISENSTIGFIGLGAMGQLMARRLLTSGFKLVVYDHTSRKASALVADGARRLRAFASSQGNPTSSSHACPTTRRF